MFTFLACFKFVIIIFERPCNSPHHLKQILGTLVSRRRKDLIILYYAKDEKEILKVMAVMYQDEEPLQLPLPVRSSRTRVRNN